MKTFDVLDVKTDVFGRHFLEASAGTGKTFAIEHLIVRLLLESSLDMQLDQILIVTFTKAAAFELKTRVYTNLARIVSSLKKKEALFDYLQPYLADPDAAINRLQEALSLFDLAPIFTIHSFCFRLLSEFAYEADSNLTLSAATDLEVEQAALQVLQDFLFFPTDNSLICTQQLFLLRKKYKSVLALASAIAERAPEKKARPFSSLHRLYKAVIEKLPYEIEAELFLSDYEQMVQRCKKKHQEAGLAQAQILARVLSDQDSSEPAFQTLIEWGESFFLLLNDKKIGPGKAPVLLNYPDLFGLLDDLLRPVLQEASDPDNIFALLAGVLHPQVQDLLLRQDKISFDQILCKAMEAASRTVLQESLQKKYRAVIIDEFQDTDPVQWNIFKTLFLHQNLTAFYLVGDPKQSIYRFRQADVYTYLKAGLQLGQDAAYSLNTNFRSAPELIKALNILFSKDFAGDWLQLPALGSALSYLPVNSGSKQVAIEDGKKSVHFFITEDARRGKRWPGMRVEVEALFPFIAREVLYLVKEKGFYWKQFAVLVKDRYQAMRMQQFLRKFNIPSATRSRENVLESRVFDVLKDIIAAVLDFTKIKTALAGPYIGYSSQDILDFEQNMQPVWEKFAQLKSILEGGLPAFFKTFLEMSWQGDQTTYERMAADESALYADTMQLMEIMLERSRQVPYRDALLLMEEIRKMDSSKILKSGNMASDAVNIMTMHMSKGLEFDVVFALGLANRHEDKERDEIEAEKLRQLYVALTRAKKRVYIPVVFDLAKAGFKPSAPIELFLQFAFAKMPDRQTFLERLDAFGEIFSYSEAGQELPAVYEQTLQKMELKKPPLIKLPEVAGQIYSFSNLAHSLALLPISPLHQVGVKAPERSDCKSSSINQYKLDLQSDPCGSFHARLGVKELWETALEREKVIIEPGALPPGPETGVILHSIFERAIQLPNKENLQSHVAALLAFTHLEGFEEQVFQIVQNTFNSPLCDGQKSFLLSDLDPAETITEMEFLFPHKEHCYKGFIDLIFAHAGKYYLLDWKTNYLPSYEPDFLEKAMREHDYHLQAAIYSEAFFRYLKIMEDGDCEQKFGGVFYLFVRGMTPKSPGCGILHLAHPRNNLFAKEGVCSAF